MRIYNNTRSPLAVTMPGGEKRFWFPARAFSEDIDEGQLRSMVEAHPTLGYHFSKGYLAYEKPEEAAPVGSGKSPEPRGDGAPTSSGGKGPAPDKAPASEGKSEAPKASEPKGKS